MFKRRIQKKNPVPQFGDIFYATLTQDGCVQGGKCPVVIVQNNVGNLHSPIVEVLPITTKTQKATYMPTHVSVSANNTNGLKSDSVVLAEQVRVINKIQLQNKIGILSHSDLVEIGRARNIQSPFPAE